MRRPYSGNQSLETIGFGIANDHQLFVHPLRNSKSFVEITQQTCGVWTHFDMIDSNDSMKIFVV